MTDKTPEALEPELYTHQTLAFKRDSTGMEPSGVHIGVSQKGICEQGHVEGETHTEIHEWVSVSTATAILRRQHQRIEELEKALRDWFAAEDRIENLPMFPVRHAVESAAFNLYDAKQAARALLSTTQQEDSQA